MADPTKSNVGDSFSIAEVPPEGDQFDQVLALHKAAKNHLGFLPDEGFRDRAAADTLLATLDAGRVLGYVLFDLRRNHVKIVHLCVCAEARGRGIARALIEEVADRYSDLSGIVLACRRDYPADSLWPRLGFTPLTDRPGRSNAGHLLTTWLRDHGHPNLFSELPTDREFVAIDQMVLEDLTVVRPHGPESVHLTEDWVGELIELCVTDQVFQETHECEDEQLRKRLRSSAQKRRHIARGAIPPQSLLSELARLAPGAGQGDHRHLALAILGGASYFVTRDVPLLESADLIAEQKSISVLWPHELIDALDRSRRYGIYEPAALQGTAISEAPLSVEQLNGFAAALLNYGAGERIARMRSELRQAFANPDREVIALRSRSGTILGGLIRAREPGSLRLELLRVSGRDARAKALARQLVFAQRQLAAAERIAEVEVADANLAATAIGALEAEGFHKAEQSWSCSVRRGILDCKELPIAERDQLGAAARERASWPLKVTGAGVPTFMISIEPAWAEMLFDTVLAGATLLPREEGLGLSREHVYYRGASRPVSLQPPSRILWYVKGGRHGHPEGELRATSQLAQVMRGPAGALHRRFSHLGAWDEKDVLGAAGASGEVIALRFTDTELLDKPLSIPELKKLYAELGKPFQPPQSPVSVPEEVFDLLYRRSSSYAD